MKTGFYWYRYRQIAQQNRLKNVETDWGRGTDHWRHCESLRRKKPSINDVGPTGYLYGWKQNKTKPKKPVTR